jgi:hypothetical protein
MAFSHPRPTPAVLDALSGIQASEKQDSFPIASVRRKHQRLPSNHFSEMPRLEPIQYLFAALYAEAFPIKASGFTSTVSRDERRSC